MSRSYRKTSMIGQDSNPNMKRIAAKRVRATVRNVLHSGLDLDEQVFPTATNQELTSSYDICDWYYLPNKNNETDTKFYIKGKRK